MPSLNILIKARSSLGTEFCWELVRNVPLNSFFWSNIAFLMGRTTLFNHFMKKFGSKTYSSRFASTYCFIKNVILLFMILFSNSGNADSNLNVICETSGVCSMSFSFRRSAYINYNSEVWKLIPFVVSDDLYVPLMYISSWLKHTALLKFSLSLFSSLAFF